MIRSFNNPTKITRNNFCRILQTLASYIFETSQRRHVTDILFEKCSIHLKDITQKTCLSRCFWDVLMKSKKRHLFEMYLRRVKEVLRGLWYISLNRDLIEISQRHLMPARSNFKTNKTNLKITFFFVIVLINHNHSGNLRTSHV